MFALRGLAVSLSVFVTVYCALSVTVSLTWRRGRLLIGRQPVRRAAGVLFALRMLPLSAAALITAGFAVPSFLLLEPRTIVEPIGGLPLALGTCGVVVVAFGLGNTFAAVWRASRTISGWMKGSRPVGFAVSLPVLRTAGAMPPMTAVGIVRPKILLSEAAESLLDVSELRSALNHEIAHVRRHDNLKKLLLRFVVFPGMRELEEWWLEATEMAADDAAVSDSNEALDLAAALIKLCRLGPLESFPDLSMSLVHSPAAVVNERVERLIHWSDQPHPRQRPRPGYALGLGMVLLPAVVLNYGQLLVGVHIATEWLVR